MTDLAEALSRADAEAERRALAGAKEESGGVRTGRDIAKIVGGTAGAVIGGAAGLPGGPVGAAAGTLAGAGLGTAAGRQLFDIGAEALDFIDARPLAERFKEAGFDIAEGSAGQAVGGVIGSAVNAGAKLAIVGGKAARQAVADVLSDFKTFGGMATAGQAGENRAFRTIESFLAKAPGAAGRIEKFAEENIGRVKTFLDTETSRIAGRGGRIEPEVVGRTVERGIGGFVSRFKERSGVLYDELDKFVPGQTPVAVGQTQAAFKELTNPTPGAPETGSALVQPAIAKLASAFEVDAAGGAIPYEALKQIRSAIGRRLTDVSLVDDLPRAEMKRLYAAITADLRGAAAAQGDDALKAFDRAGAFYQAGLKRVEETLQPLIDKGVPEKIFSSLESGMRQGGTQIRTVLRSLSGDERQLLGAAIVRRLGRSTPGQQDALGEAFSFETFLTNWNRLAPESREAVFSQLNLGKFASDINAVARVADNMRQGARVFSNPSGTAAASIGQTAIFVGGGGAVTGLGNMLGLYSAGEGFMVFPAMLAMGAMGANMGARLMTSPRFVNWLAQAPKFNANGIGAHLGRLAALGEGEDPDTRQAIVEYIDKFGETLAGMQGE